MNDYLLKSVRHQLIRDGQLKVDEIDSVKHPSFGAELLQKIDSLHAAILERRDGEPIDIDAIIELVRNERDAELYNLS